MGAGVGLHRILDLCRDPLREEWLPRTDAIKVAGSNGKGSVCAMVSSILRSAGVSTGLYTSPHLFDFRERIVIDGEPISAEALAFVLAWFETEHERYQREHPDDQVGAFEAFTALAVHHFSRLRPEAAVIEAGIGGRFDPTRLFLGRLTALVSLDLEHTALLGDSLEQIAYDKADLADGGSLQDSGTLADGGTQADSTLVVGAVPPEIFRRLRAYARLRGVRAVLAEDVCRLGRFATSDRCTRLEVEVESHDGWRVWSDLELSLLGTHQVGNAQVAIALALRWLARHRQAMSARRKEEAVRVGLASVSWPCRLQKVREDPDVFVDAAHTPAAILALSRSIEEILPDRRIVLVTGVSRDRDAAAILSRLLPVADEVIATSARHKGRPSADIASIVQAQAPELPLATQPKLQDALIDAQIRASRDGSVILVAGGLFLAAEAARLIAAW